MGKDWTGEEEEVLHLGWADTPSEVIADMLGRSKSGCQKKASIMGLKKSKAYVSKIHAEKYFPKKVVYNGSRPTLGGGVEYIEGNRRIHIMEG